jgi:putative glutamine amidotransferase
MKVLFSQLPKFSLLALCVAAACRSNPPAPVVAESSAKPSPVEPVEKAPPAPVAPPSYVPVVGINGVEAGSNCEGPDSPCSRSENVRLSLEHAGAKWTHLMAEGNEQEAARELLDSVDCLVLRGGADINPARYGERPDPSLSLISTRRERFDFALVKEAMRRKMPLLGICLGAQELNVVADGDLVQDIPSEIEGFMDHRSDHSVQSVPETLFAEIYGESVQVHSNHHQSPDKAGVGLRVSARAADGVVEAIEAVNRETYPFLLGVQFHPEHQINTAHDALFQRFARACQEYRGKH